jgi:hypothetical protein
MFVEQFPNSLSITLLGSAGGAAKAVLAILNQAIELDLFHLLSLDLKLLKLLLLLHQHYQAM